MNRRIVSRWIALSVALFPVLLPASGAEQRPNIMFISVDDMSCDSVGVVGCRLPDTTPHIDRLASEGVRFEYAHVQVGNCMPCRNVLFSGRYPHNNGVEGFYQIEQPQHAHLCELMKQGGYFTAIRGKVSHSSPYTPFAWDLVLDEIDGEKMHAKNIRSYYKSSERGIQAAAEADRPFCLLVNVSDPHKPFYAMGKGQDVIDDPNVPSRVFTAEEVPIPGFLFDDPDVRKELAHYYSSVRRADDCVGAALQALEDSGKADSTVVVFLSDHGMPLPFAKTALYHHSTRTPWIVRWPGVVKPGGHDTVHMISGVDLLPTLLDVADIGHPAGLEGRSIVSILKGEFQGNRDFVFKEYNENSAGNRHPMRGVQGKRFGYLFNPWSDGTRVFKTATTGTLTYRRLKELAEEDDVLAARFQTFQYAAPEQFFDYQNDPDALHNLIDDPEYQTEIERLRSALEDWMVRSGDHALDAFRHRDDPHAVEAYMQKVEAESAARLAGRRGRRKLNIIQLNVPDIVIHGRVELTVRHRLPDALKTQLLHVTIKDRNQQRIERKVVEITGRGSATVVFSIDTATVRAPINVAAFVGPDFGSNLQHVTSKPVPLKTE